MGMVRFALALAVLLSHLELASYKFLGGALAVQSFFIISGFYMALVLDGKYKDVSLFYSNRLLRLFPTYIVACVLAALTTWVFNASPTASPEIFATLFSNPVTAIVLVLTNIFMLGQELLFWFTFDPAGNLVFDASGAVPNETVTMGWQGLLVPQSWSLSMELMFYAIAPFLARAGWKWILGIAIASIGLRLAGGFIDGVDYHLWQGRFFPTALFLFLLGMLAHKTLPLVAKLPTWLGYAAAAALLVFIATAPLLNLDPLKGRWVVYAVVTPLIPFAFNAFKDIAWDRWIGDLSYPMYLSQLMVIGLVVTYAPPFGLWVAIFGTIALSALLLILIEHPLDRWRQRRLRNATREPAAAPGAATVAPL